MKIADGLTVKQWTGEDEVSKPVRHSISSSTRFVADWRVAHWKEWRAARKNDGTWIRHFIYVAEQQSID